MKTQAAASNDRYLWSRSNTRMIWYSVPVPKEHQARVGRKVWQGSLGTTDRREALLLVGQKRAELIGESRCAANDQTAPSARPHAVALEIYNSLLGRLEAARRAAPADDHEQDAMIAKREADLRRMSRRMIDGDVSQWEAMAARSIEHRGLPIELGSDEHRALAAAFAEVSIDAVSVFTRRHQGEIDAEPRSAIVRAEREREGATAKSGETILELYDAYSIWRSQPGRKRRRRLELMAKDRVAVELFAEFVGEHRAIRSITKDDARSFRDMLAQFPASRGKKPKLANASIAECINTAARGKLNLLSLTTQAKYLSIISPLFDWMISDGPRHIALAHNVFDGLHPALEKGENRRPSYTAAQLNTFIASPLFSQCRGAGKEHVPGDVAVRDHRYWIPLLCLFTGSRVTEIAQLHVDDVAVEDDVPLILLTHDEGSGRHVKGKKSRIAALHQILIDAGFVDYWRAQIERAQRDGNRQLFPKLKARADGPLGAAPSRWLGRYLTRIGIKDGADGYGAHSFRHTMADAMRAAGFIDIEFGQLVLGHSNNTITSAYGSLPQGAPARLKAMVDAAFMAKPFSEVAFDRLATNFFAS